MVEWDVKMKPLTEFICRTISVYSGKILQIYSKKCTTLLKSFLRITFLVISCYMLLKTTILTSSAKMYFYQPVSITKEIAYLPGQYHPCLYPSLFLLTLFSSFTSSLKVILVIYKIENILVIFRPVWIAFKCNVSKYYIL